MNFSYSLTENARRFANKVAIVDGAHRYTYRDFNARVDGLARALLEQGLGPGSMIGILMWNRVEFLEAYYASMRIGAITVPLNFRMAGEELHYELDHSGCQALFTEARFHDILEPLLPRLKELKLVVSAADEIPSGWHSHAALRETPGAPVADATKSLDDVQRIMYTSGTTSRPKAAMATNGQITYGALTRMSDFGLTSDDVTLTVGPLFHVGALDTYATPMLFLGGTVVILEKFTTHDVLRLVAKERVTCGWLAPTMVNMIFQEPDVADYDFSSFRVLLVGGEKSPMPLLERIKRQWPHSQLYDVYGLTECQGLATFLPPEYSIPKIGSVGKAARGREIRLVDDNDMDVPPGTPGEVLVRGPVVFPGYFKDEEATKAALRGGWLHTGDMAIADEDGFLFIVDRKKDIIRSGAENLSASEVERVIYQLPDILDAAVVAMPDAKWTEVPAAFIVVKAGATLTAQAVIDHCLENLAKFKVPKLVRHIESLPRTPSGKVMKKDLRALLQEEQKVKA